MHIFTQLIHLTAIGPRMTEGCRKARLLTSKIITFIDDECIHAASRTQVSVDREVLVTPYQCNYELTLMYQEVAKGM